MPDADPPSRTCFVSSHSYTPPGAEIRRFEGHENSVVAVARVDDRRLVSGSFDYSLRLWDLDTVAALRRFEGHEEWVWAVARVYDRRVVSGSGDGALRL